MEQVEYGVALSEPRAFSYDPDVADFPVSLMYGAFARSGSTPMIRFGRPGVLTTSAVQDTHQRQGRHSQWISVQPEPGQLAADQTDHGGAKVMSTRQ